MIRLRKARGAILSNVTNKIREAGRPNPPLSPWRLRSRGLP